MKKKPRKPSGISHKLTLSSSASLRISSSSFSLCLTLAVDHDFWKHSNKWSSCSGEKSHASLARRSCTFFTMASCWSIWAFHISWRSWRLSDPALILNRMTFSSFSTYWGWWRESLRTIWSTRFSLSQRAIRSAVRKSSSPTPPELTMVSPAELLALPCPGLWRLPLCWPIRVNRLILYLTVVVVVRFNNHFWSPCWFWYETVVMTRLTSLRAFILPPNDEIWSWRRIIFRRSISSWHNRLSPPPTPLPWPLFTEKCKKMRCYFSNRILWQIA